MDCGKMPSEFKRVRKAEEKYYLALSLLKTK